MSVITGNKKWELLWLQLTCVAWQSWQLLANTTAFHCQHYARFIKSLYFIQSIRLLCHDLMMNCLLCPRNCQVVTLELTQLPHYVACRAGAEPVCFFVSNRAEPTNCEHNLSAPVAVYYGWTRRVEETTFFFVNSLAEKSQESACYAAAGYRIVLLGCLVSERYLTIEI